MGPSQDRRDGESESPRLCHEGDTVSQQVRPQAPGEQEAWRSFPAPQQVRGPPMALETRSLEHVPTGH